MIKSENFKKNKTNCMTATESQYNIPITDTVFSKEELA